ncbi:hypothetical protein AB0M43_17360 [Longispora sp. NPDC051575]|uniref:hypothetical protein n=1 Tax=Longispora sp. NPDC051575 TaxID=3154943 RepID=UPI00344A2BC8
MSDSLFPPDKPPRPWWLTLLWILLAIVLIVACCRGFYLFVEWVMPEPSAQLAR